MTTTVGEDLLTAMAELRALFPDWRVGQLVANLTQAAGRDGEGATAAGARRVVVVGGQQVHLGECRDGHRADPGVDAAETTDCLTG